MDDLPRQRLGELLVRQGRGLLDDPRRLEALLRDLCPQQRREVNLLTGAARERVPADLLSSSDGIPKAVLVARLQQRLEENLGLAPDAARWAVESWGLALGVLAPGDVPAPSPAAPSPSARPPMPAPPRTSARARPAATSPSPASPPRVAPGAAPVPRPAPAAAPPPTVGATSGSAAGPPVVAGRGPQPPGGGATAPRKRSGAVFGVLAAVAAVAIVGGVVAAGRSGSRGSNSNRAPGRQPTAAPCYTGTTPPAPALGVNAGNPVGRCPASGPPSSPDALYRALLAASFSTGELPPGFSVHDITSRQPNGDEARLHAAGVVIVELDSSVSAVNRGQIEYVVYPSDAGAQADYDVSKTRQVVGGTALGNFMLTGLPGPSVCQFGTNQAAPAAACLLRSGQTLVQSFASRQGDQAAAEADAVVLESDAVAHLERVGSGR